MNWWLVACAVFLAIGAFARDLFKDQAIVKRVPHANRWLLVGSAIAALAALAMALAKNCEPPKVFDRRLATISPPPPDPQRFTVAVARLDGDDANKAMELVVADLRELGADAGLGEHAVRVVRWDGVVDGGTTALPEEDERRATEDAQRVLHAAGANVLIWGRVVGIGAPPMLALKLSVSDKAAAVGPHPVTEHYHRYRLNDDQRLPAGFLDDLSDALRLSVLEQYAEISQQGQPSAEAIFPLIARLGAIVTSNRFRAWEPRDRGAIYIALGLSRMMTYDSSTFGLSALYGAVDAYRHGIDELLESHEIIPLVTARVRLGMALLVLGQQTATVQTIRDAEANFQAALGSILPDRDPIGWATVTGDLGMALLLEGAQQQDVHTLESGLAATLSVLSTFTPERSPGDWALAETNIGQGYQHIAEINGDAKAAQNAVAAIMNVKKLTSINGSHEERAKIQTALGTASTVQVAVFYRHGRRTDAMKVFAQAHHAFARALRVLTSGRAPAERARTNVNNGNAFVALGQLDQNPSLIERAIRSYDAAIRDVTEQNAPATWATAQMNRGVALALLASGILQDRHGANDVDSGEAIGRSIAGLTLALHVFTETSAPMKHADILNTIEGLKHGQYVGGADGDMASVSDGRFSVRYHVRPPTDLPGYDETGITIIERFKRCYDALPQHGPTAFRRTLQVGPDGYVALDGPIWLGAFPGQPRSTLSPQALDCASNATPGLYFAPPGSTGRELALDIEVK